MVLAHNKKYMKQTVEEAAHSFAESRSSGSAFPAYYVGFIAGSEWQKDISSAKWQSKQSPWISVKEQLPEENENIIIMCKHGAIFNGTYCNGVWFCMDGYINDVYKDSPIYSSMSSIPPLWEPVAWMPIPSFDEILEANKDVLKRIN